MVDEEFAILAAVRKSCQRELSEAVDVIPPAPVCGAESLGSTDMICNTGKCRFWPNKTDHTFHQPTCLEKHFNLVFFSFHVPGPPLSQPVLRGDVS